MSSHPPWTPPEDYVYPVADEPETVPEPDASPEPAPVWSPEEPPPMGPLPEGASRGPRGAVVAVVLAVAIVVLGGTALYVGISRGDDGDANPKFSVGTGSGRPQLERPKVPEGYELFADDDGSFAVVVPDGWQKVLLDPTSVRRARDRLEDDDPPVAAALATAAEQLGDIGGLAFAAEPHDRDGTLANVTLVLTPRSTESLTQIAAEGRAGIERRGGTVGDARAVTIGDREALIEDVAFDTSRGRVSEQQVYVASGFRIYLLTLSGVDPATAQAITTSLRVP